MERRSFLKNTAGTLAGGLLIPNINFGAQEEIIFGQGKHQYKLIPQWADFGKIPVNDCHEMVMDSKGRLIFNTNELKNNIIICDKKGKFIKSWGTEFPGAHGLTIFNENGEDVLFITDTVRKQVFKMTLDGKLIFKLNAPLDANKYLYDGCYYSPTETTVLPNGDFYVADGYGEQYITIYNHKGEIKSVFGGNGEEDAKFTQCHGIAYDNRDKANPCLLITDRKKHQLKRFSLDGKYLSTIQFSNIWNCRPVVKGENVYMAVLKCSADLDWKDDRIKGSVLILDKNNKAVSAIGSTQPEYKNDKMQQVVQNLDLFQFPHDVCVDDEENLYVTQWNSGKVYPFKFQKVS
ncbi:MAG TPA: 6-bladed beta-propeller [Cytophagaceae bacterium]|jgi:hypothetical protein